MSMKVASLIKLRNKTELRLWLATLPTEVSMQTAKKLLKKTNGKGYVLWLEGWGFKVF
jgi:hypothetical protein